MPTSWNSGDESIYPWGYILTPQSGHVLRATMPAVGSGQSRPQPHPRASRTVSGIILGSRPAPPAASPAAASPRGKGVVTVRSDEIKRGVARAPHRSLLRALGISDAEMEKPFIGIANSFSEVVPGHMHLRSVVEAVKAGVRGAGGVPLEFGVMGICDGIAMNHLGMHYSLPSRELIADTVESMTIAHAFDALVLVPTCDTIVPGMLMAAMRLNVPAIMVGGGPMLAGHLDGRTIDLNSVFEAVGRHQAGVLDDEGLKAVECGACPTCGSCSGMFTANSMNCLAEVIGMALPGNGTIPAPYSERLRYAKDAGAKVMDVLAADLKPRDLGKQVAGLEVGGQHVHDLGAGVFGVAQALAVRRRDGAVAGQRHTDDLGEAIHGVGREHARAGAAGGAGAAFDGLEALVVKDACLVAAHRLEHAVEVDGVAVQMAGEHGPAADHDGGHVEAHGGHEHAGHDLVAGRHQHQRIEGVGDGHGFDGVGDELAAGQGVEHAQMVHGDAVADAHDAELQGHAAGAAHAGLDGLDDAAQVHVTGHDFAEGVGDADERLLHLGVADAEMEK